eukprot:m.124615 g.124615  ORF g.124615 m.124615 type:complete len:313 (-) comp14652_c3_seq1:184-1122(-)
MAKGKDHHVFVSDEGDDANDGTEAFPVKTIEAAKRVMVQRGHDKCMGIRLLSGKVLTSPCGQRHCGSCTKANGRRPCPGPGCDKWISVSAKQHAECGWRKPETDKKPAQPEYVFKGEDQHGFEKLKRKMIALARQAALQYGWDGIIMGYAAKVGRGGSTARITFVSPQNELYTLDERGSLKVQQGLDDHLSINADNALTLIRQKICPNLYGGERVMKHDGLLAGEHGHHHHHHYGSQSHAAALAAGAGAGIRAHLARCACIALWCACHALVPRLAAAAARARVPTCAFAAGRWHPGPARLQPGPAGWSGRED